jgi:hypothetical protein
MQDSICGIGEDFSEHYRIGVDKLVASRGVTAESDPDAHERALYELVSEARDAGAPMPEIERGS